MVKALTQSGRSNKRATKTPLTFSDVYLAEVVAVSPVRDFIVDVTFSDGSSRKIDLEPYLHGPIFEPIRRDRQTFRTIKVQAGTIGWENGADIDPDTLYYDGNPPWAAPGGLPKPASGAPPARRRTRANAKA